MNVYSYIRFSSQAQRSGDSYRRQEEGVRKYCEKHKLKLAEDCFFDDGKSAYAGDHLSEKGQLRRFLDLVKAGVIPVGSTLIVESLDRLSREDVTTALTRFLELMKAGIRIVTLSDERVYDNKSEATDLIVSIFIMSRAHEESVNKSRRIGAAWANKRKMIRDTKLTKMVPSWISIVDGVFVLNEKADLVKQVFDLALDGHGAISISKTLNKNGVKALKGGDWAKSSVVKILKSKNVLGHLQLKSGGVDVELVEDYYPRVISDEVFYTVLKLMKDRKIEGSGVRQTTRFNVWGGIARCGVCNASMQYINKGKSWQYLKCSNAIKGVCDSKGVNYHHLENVFKKLVGTIDSSELINTDNRVIDGLKGKLIELEHRLEVNEDNYRKTLSPTALKVADEIRTQIKEVQEQIDTETKAKAVENVEVDLVSYGGRMRANRLVKNAKLIAFVNVCTVKVDNNGWYFFSENGDIAVFPWNLQMLKYWKPNIEEGNRVIGDEYQNFCNTLLSMSKERNTNGE